jgi:N-acetylmuramoyl-L-alanine amidase
METSSSTTPVTPRRTGISTVRILQTSISLAIVLATIFTGLPPRVFSKEASGRYNLLLTPEAPSVATLTAPNTPLKIGIVPGHWGNDSGTVCEDGTTEVDVNLEIAKRVRDILNSRYGYDVDLLEEFDVRLDGYEAAVLISIHNDSCEYVNEEATGFKVSASMGSTDVVLAARLTNCLTERYAAVTNLPFHAGSITPDMTYYHAFEEIDSSTNSAIIETGFLYKDFLILTQHPEVVAEGIVSGIICYVNYENVDPATGISP